MKRLLAAVWLLVAPAADAMESDASRWDPRMAAEGAVVDTNGVKWIDGRLLPLEGRAFGDVEEFYDRLPADTMYAGDTEGTVDGVHPNDLGMMSMADAFGGCLRTALGLE